MQEGGTSAAAAVAVVTSTQEPPPACQPGAPAAHSARCPLAAHLDVIGVSVVERLHRRRHQLRLSAQQPRHARRQQRVSHVHLLRGAGGVALQARCQRGRQLGRRRRVDLAATHRRQGLGQARGGRQQRVACGGQSGPAAPNRVGAAAAEGWTTSTRRTQPAVQPCPSSTRHARPVHPPAKRGSGTRRTPPACSHSRFCAVSGLSQRGRP